jgi:hypothetical protein
VIPTAVDLRIYLFHSNSYDFDMPYEIFLLLLAASQTSWAGPIPGRRILEMYVAMRAAFVLSRAELQADPRDGSKIYLQSLLFSGKHTGIRTKILYSLRSISPRMAQLLS